MQADGTHRFSGHGDLPPAAFRRRPRQPRTLAAAGRRLQTPLVGSTAQLQQLLSRGQNGEASCTPLHYSFALLFVSFSL